jgi:hypothetical protein
MPARNKIFDVNFKIIDKILFNRFFNVNDNKAPGEIRGFCLAAIL